jgi:N-6 DNA Methylase
MQALQDLVARLASRDGKRSEATLQADVRTLLLTAPFDLDAGDLHEVNLESPVGDRRRIDVETGTTVFEIKRDLRRGKALADAEQQLAGYVETRESQMGRRYAGVITDGAEWRCYYLSSTSLVQASFIEVRKEKPDVDALLIWLEGVLATAQGLTPTPTEIQIRLGAGSSSHELDRSSLIDIYARFRDLPTVKMKRQLWARLLTTALGAQFEDRDDLFVEHTLLVNSADIIAHAVLGLQVAQLSPASLLSGSKFTEGSIHGVVEADFFDWVLEVPGGEAFVHTLARRLARFDWSNVEHDVLKVLYESVIGRDTRKKLGEYYTPDWLAERIVETTIRDPLAERVLDPACGSGTFLFHAVRRYLAAAEASGMPIPEAIEGTTRHVLGMDLHPVAVTLARVTYVLALGRDRLSHPERGEIQIPVYLGDSLQWQQEQPGLWTNNHLVIQADEGQLFLSELRFPNVLLADARNFDELVQELANRASKRKANSSTPSLVSVFQRLAIPIEARKTIEATFDTMCRLHDQGRDHIWATTFAIWRGPCGWHTRTEWTSLLVIRPGSRTGT